MKFLDKFDVNKTDDRLYPWAAGVALLVGSYLTLTFVLWSLTAHYMNKRHFQEVATETMRNIHDNYIH